MKNKAFEGFLFKITHPVSYDFNSEERELIAENVAVKTKIATWEDVDFVAEMQKMLAVIGEYHRLKRDSESLRAFAEKDRNEYGKRK